MELSPKLRVLPKDENLDHNDNTIIVFACLYFLLSML